jgi:hypothetical protein
MKKIAAIGGALVLALASLLALALPSLRRYLKMERM